MVNVTKQLYNSFLMRKICTCSVKLYKLMGVWQKMLIEHVHFFVSSIERSAEYKNITKFCSKNGYPTWLDNFYPLKTNYLIYHWAENRNKSDLNLPPIRYQMVGFTIFWIRKLTHTNIYKCFLQVGLKTSERGWPLDIHIVLVNMGQLVNNLFFTGNRKHLLFLLKIKMNIFKPPPPPNPWMSNGQLLS